MPIMMTVQERRTAVPDESAAGAPSGHARFYSSAAIAIILLGIVLRAIAYGFGRPLWLDEAMLALNVATRSFGDLVRPLAFDQWAPPLFVWLERVAVQVAGVSEHSLRFFPFLAGVGLVLLAWPIARRMLGDRDALIATAILALQLSLSRYASEVKPYGVDAFVTMAMLGLLVLVLARPGGGGRWLLLGFGGAFAVMLSYPAIFILTGIAAALVVDERTRSAPRWKQRFVAVCVSWAVTFALLFIAQHERGTSDAYLARYWDGSYLLRMLTAEGTWLRGAVFCTGVAVLLARQKRAVAAACLVPFLALATAAALHAYPLTTRLMVFLAPISAIAYAVVVGLVLERFRGRLQLAACALLLIAMVGRQLYQAGPYLGQSVNWEDSRSLAQWIMRERHGEPVYVNGFGAPAWMFYTTDWARPDTARLAWLENVQSFGGPAFPNRPSRGRSVSEEGHEVYYAGEAGLDIIGIATGMEYRNAYGYSQASPDPGWAANEVARIQSVSTPFAWVFLSHYAPPQELELIAAIEAAGGKVLESGTRRGAAAHRVCVPPMSGEDLSAARAECGTPRADS